MPFDKPLLHPAPTPAHIEAVLKDGARPGQTGALPDLFHPRTLPRAPWRDW